MPPMRDWRNKEKKKWKRVSKEIKVKNPFLKRNIIKIRKFSKILF